MCPFRLLTSNSCVFAHASVHFELQIGLSLAHSDSRALYRPGRCMRGRPNPYGVLRRWHTNDKNRPTLSVDIYRPIKLADFHVTRARNSNVRSVWRDAAAVYWFITKCAQNAPKTKSNAKMLGASMGYKTVNYLFYTQMFINCDDMTNLLNIKAQ